MPETDVFRAADTVLARGERPTVERVRIELGRGSPARVSQLLEQWWERLAQRLQGHTLLPELPGEVAQAFAEAWRLAFAHSAAAAQQALIEKRNDLFALETSLTQERKVWEIALAEAQADQADSATKLAQAELRLAERQTLLDQLIAQVRDGNQQRDYLQGQLDIRNAELEEVRTEFDALEVHIRAVEDRAHQQVDQSRQEIKVLGQQQERGRREHAKQIAELTAQRDILQAALRTAEQTAAHQAGQLAALESTIKQWQRVQTVSPARAPRKTPPAPEVKPRRPRKKISP